jgi:hypothetical protein
VSKQFEQTVENIFSCINCDPHDKIVINAFLVSFAEHIVANIASIDLCRKSIEEIAQGIPDMPAISQPLTKEERRCTI